MSHMLIPPDFFHVGNAFEGWGMFWRGSTFLIGEDRTEVTGGAGEKRYN